VAHVKVLVDAFRAEGKIVLPADSDVQGGAESFEVPPAQEPSDDIRLRVGEAVYNFRAALDYSIHVISGGKGQSQFPIESKRERFEARKTGRLPNGKNVAAYLKGVGVRECDLIKAVQPCEGADWTTRLAALSNRDKHRDLVVVNAASTKPFTREDLPALYPSDNLYPSDSLYPSDGGAEMHVETPIDIALDDGVLVTEALEEIEVSVRALLTALEGR